MWRTATAVRAVRAKSPEVGSGAATGNGGAGASGKRILFSSLEDVTGKEGDLGMKSAEAPGGSGTQGAIGRPPEPGEYRIPPARRPYGYGFGQAGILPRKGAPPEPRENPPDESATSGGGSSKDSGEKSLARYGALRMALIADPPAGSPMIEASGL